MRAKLTAEGQAYTVRNGRRTYVWADCWRCGCRQVPTIATRGNDASIVARLEPGWSPNQRTRLLVACGTCDATVPAFTAEECARHASSPERCGGACLNGKRSCNCRCKGRCHGAGRCACGDTKEATC